MNQTKIAAAGNYRTADLRRAVGAKRKTGTFPALPGWSCGGRPIIAVEFARYEIVRYLDEAGEPFATFQDFAGIDD